jgi:hypothetical protein
MQVESMHEGLVLTCDSILPTAKLKIAGSVGPHTFALYQYYLVGQVKVPNRASKTAAKVHRRHMHLCLRLINPTMDPGQTSGIEYYLFQHQYGGQDSSLICA